MNITLNNEKKHFVVNTGNSVSCMGFHVVYTQALEMAKRLKAVSERTLLAKGMAHLLGLVLPDKSEIGTLFQYEQYRALLAGYSKLDDKKTWFDSNTPTKLRKALEAARTSGARVRVFMGDGATGKDWLWEYDVIGRIERSSGSMKVPLLVPEGECGGPTLSTDCIVRLVDLDTDRELYRHAKYHLPKIDIVEAESYDQADGYTHTAKVENADGEIEPHAKFKSQVTAAHWLTYVNGHSHTYHTGR